MAGEVVAVVVAAAAEEATAETEVVEAVKVVSPEETNPNIVVPSIRISQMASGRGAVCISAGVGVHFSVQSPVPAPGRMFILSKNEPVTNSAKKNLNSLTTHCTRNRSFQKYTQYMEMKFSQSRSLYYPQLSGVLKMFGKILSR